jgi:hypothetical protein
MVRTQVGYSRLVMSETPRLRPSGCGGLLTMRIGARHRPHSLFGAGSAVLPSSHSFAFAHIGLARHAPPERRGARNAGRFTASTALRVKLRTRRRSHRSRRKASGVPRAVFEGVARTSPGAGSLYAPLFRPPAGGGSRGFRLPAAPCVTMRAGHRIPAMETLRAGSGPARPDLRPRGPDPPQRSSDAGLTPP